MTAYLATSRPTAVNLFWALDRMKAAGGKLRGRPPAEIAACLLDEARGDPRRRPRDVPRDRRARRRTATDGQGVLTHCNAGGLATSEYGTALAVFFMAAEQGKRLSVFADETRPLLQGARLTAWELQHAGLDVTVICDSMAAQVMREGRVQAVVTGADRIAANGDTANKIGTYGVAVWPPRTRSLFTSPHPRARSIFPSPAAAKSPSSSATPARSRTASAGRPPRRA